MTELITRAPAEQRDRAARAKPLVLWIAREAGQRELGIIYTNGRDERARKDAALIISKRARCSLSKVELIDFESADAAAQINAVAAEDHELAKLDNAIDQRWRAAHADR